MVENTHHSMSAGTFPCNDACDAAGCGSPATAVFSGMYLCDEHFQEAFNE